MMANIQNDPKDRRSGQGGARERGSRSPRPQLGGRDKMAPAAGFPGQTARGERDQGRGPHPSDRREGRRTEPAPKPYLEGWNITLIPAPSALEAIAKQIRSRAKTYPLFELARLIIRLSDRYNIQLKAGSDTSPELFRVTTDGSLWTSRREAISHVLSKHLEKFYRRSSILVEAPKGSYSVVAQCSMSGVLLGPPNHHEYQSRLLALHATRFKNLPFEVYKTRIKMMRDEALMEQWKTEQTTRTVYFPITSESEAAPAEAPLPSETPTTETAVIENSLTTEPHMGEPLSEVTEASGEDNPSAAFEKSADTAITETPIAEEGGLTLEEATAHFHATHAAAAIESVNVQINVQGRVALHESDPLLRELLLRTLQELDRFPLPLAQVLGKELASSGLQIFKAQKKIIHVSVARPRYLDRSTTPTSEGFRKILDYLEAHPNQHRDKQWAGLVAQITEPIGDEPEAVQRREQALGTDLLWLLHQGHVLDFAMGNLQAAHRPLPKPTQEIKFQGVEKNHPPVQETAPKETSSEAVLPADPETSEPPAAIESGQLLNESAPAIFSEQLPESAAEDLAAPRTTPE
jgi:hypothetical protein